MATCSLAYRTHTHHHTPLHPHTHTHTIILYTHTVTYTHSLTHTLTHTHTHSHIHTQSLTHPNLSTCQMCLIVTSQMMIISLYLFSKEVVASGRLTPPHIPQTKNMTLDLLRLEAVQYYLSQKIHVKFVKLFSANA